MHMKGVLSYLKDAIFPTYCVGCSKEGTWICDNCIESIPNTGVFLCPVCHETTSYGNCCDSCSMYSFLDSHIAVATYKHGTLVGKLIEALKYQYATEILASLRIIANPVLTKKRTVLTACDLIVPIPLHERRFAERGFNQAESISTMVSTVIDVPVLPILYRTKYTTQQATLDKEAREQNMNGAFAVTAKVVYDITGKDVLLVDDVYTTGSTLQQAAAVLKGAGASSVIGFSIARG